MTWKLTISILPLLLGALVAQINAQALNEAEFQRLHQELEPKDELWKSIPWQTSLLEAQRIAAETKRPIFIWAMDGHPLGCT